jgi:putative addiction module CopG family antidote
MCHTAGRVGRLFLLRGKMNVSIAKELRTYLEEQVASGRFPDADAVIADALRLHEAQLSALRDEVGKGLDDWSAGRFRSVEKEDFLARAKKLAETR